jgi:peptide/nickel transport system substrate-binding protein
MPVGSGPYLVDSVEPGTRITYRRDPNYWGGDIPSQQGFNNYQKITVEYFRDQTALFEAFKKGIFDIYPEGDPVKWESAYDFPAVTEGKVSEVGLHLRRAGDDERLLLQHAPREIRRSAGA